jgi:hypothetical protein
MCVHNNKSVYIQCKFSDKPTQINDVNHFILSSKCLQDELIKTINYKMIWVCKNNPSIVGLESLKHYNVEIIQENDLNNLINVAEQYILNYFEANNNTTNYQPIINSAFKNYEDYKELFRNQCIEQCICDTNIKGNLTLYLKNNDYKKLDKTFVEALKLNNPDKPTIQKYSQYLNSLAFKMNGLIVLYNELYKKQLPQVSEEEYFILCVKAIHSKAFKPGTLKKVKTRDEFKQYLIDPNYRFYII